MTFDDIYLLTHIICKPGIFLVGLQPETDVYLH